MFYILSWLIYGLVVGILAKILITVFAPGSNDVDGFLPTIVVGVVGSYIGGAIEFLTGHGYAVLEPSGVLMGIAGAVIALLLYHQLKIKKII